VLALEGGGDLGAAFLKNCRTHDHQEPQRGKKDQGAQCCRHRVLLGGGYVPYLFWSVKRKVRISHALET